MSAGEIFDVAVVGAGPAGSNAAIAAAEAGASTVILDRAVFPRYKTCGGGLIGPTLGSLPAGFEVPVEQRIDRISFSLRGGRETVRTTAGPLLSLVNRADFDDALLARARAAGAEVRTGTPVLSLTETADVVELTTAAGPVRARYVVGADGSASRVGRHVGVRMAQTDLGLEVEVLADGHAEEWAGRVHLDWGPLPGSYAWVFPKSKTLTVGVIARKGKPEETKAYLRDFTAAMGLAGAEVVEDSGHLTRCRTPDSPLGTSRVLVAGDAAGLLEPWTREGISYAVRSGRAAGRAVTAGADDVVAHYARGITDLTEEMAAGFAFLDLFEKHPRLMHTLVAHTPPGWRAFRRVVAGETTFARALRHRPAAALVRALT